MSSTGTLRIAILHFGDVANFGDVLFPLLVAHELRERLPGVGLDFVSPTGTGPQASLRYDAVVFDRYDAVVMAGGEVVHRNDGVMRAIYDRLGLRAIENPTDLVFGWTGVSGPYKAWVGLGVPRLDPRGQESVRQSVPNLDMVVVRGTGSARRLLEAGVAGAIGTDIGWLFPRLVPPASRPPARRAVLQVLPHNVPADLGVIIEPFQRLARRGFEVVLLPLSTCWADHTVLERIAAQSGFRMLDYRMPELAKLEVIRDSALYVGQSMHGFITTLATGHAAGLCFPPGDDKFTELLADNAIDDLRIGGWDGLAGLIDRLLVLEPTRIAQLRTRLAAQASWAFDALAVRVERHAHARRAATV